MAKGIITPDLLLSHWQGHRQLTRKTLEAFPADSLFSYSIGGMRPFSELIMELVRMAVPGLRAVINGEWQTWEELVAEYPTSETKQELLILWDNVTAQINSVWEQIPVDRFPERITCLAGQYEGPKTEETVFSTILYLVDNEIHHRGQGYVYLRSLRIDPPPFWKRDWPAVQ